MSGKQGNPTMKEVAAEAGVSLGTVSKVINNIPVGEEYRKRVEEAARKLGYQVNNYARSLRTNRTNTIALILPNLNHPYFGAIANAVAVALNRRGYSMLTSISNSDDQGEQRCLALAMAHKVDGVIAMTYNPRLEVDPQLNFVTIDRFFNAGVPCVSCDNFGGGQMAAEKLIGLGCKRLMFMRSGTHIYGEPDKRIAGFEMACKQHGIPYDTLNLHESEGLAPFLAYLDAHIKEGKADFDGLFCNTDKLAIMMVGAIRARGCRVPEDVQVIGFDGIRDFATGSYYCSTIVQPVELIAETAVSSLFPQDSSEIKPLIALPVSYAFGGTTKA